MMKSLQGFMVICNHYMAIFIFSYPTDANSRLKTKDILGSCSCCCYFADYYTRPETLHHGKFIKGAAKLWDILHNGVIFPFKVVNIIAKQAVETPL